MADSFDNGQIKPEIKLRTRSLLAAGNTDAAWHLLRQACRADNDDAETWFLFAGLSASLDRLDEVVEGCQRTVELEPRHVQAWYNLGLACFHLHRWEDAVSAYQAALDIEPDSPAVLGNLGATWLESGNPARALEYCNRAIELDPRSVAAINTLGIAYRELGKYVDALDAFERAVLIDPENTDARWNRALALLKTGDFQRGWKEFEWRWRFEKAMQRPTPYPAWRGLRPVNSLLVYMEQGLGDQIMFASCLPDLLATGSRAIVECEPRLVPLFERSFPGIRFHGGAWDERLAQCRSPIQCQIPMGSLPRIFRRDRKAFPLNAGYLIADAGLVSHWHNRLASLGDGMKIGISWRGGKDLRTRSRRSIPLTAWQAVLGTSPAVFINIQYGDQREEIEAAHRSGMEIRSIDGVDAMTDLDGFAALLMALDLVITVDNSTLHLAGALGVETWGLLPYDSDWRWEADATGTYWYPSVRLFNQPDSGDWTRVLESVSTQLAARTMKS
jgi:tetratricopeptide (TPR) repeat protein